MSEEDVVSGEPTDQDFYEHTLEEIARAYGIDPTPFRTPEYTVYGTIYRYSYVGAKDALRAAIRQARERTPLNSEVVA